MTARTRLDSAYGRRGGALTEGHRPRRTGPPCDVCGMPMILGQVARHHVCDPDTPVGKIAP